MGFAVPEVLMPVDQNQRDRRPHYHRGRRGPDRRGSDRRTTATHDTPARTADQVDVEQIMRDIRSRIAQRSGIELTTQQIQELAARRLEAILDPRTVNPSLLQQLRRGAAAAPDLPAQSAEQAYAFEADTLYESHRGLLRFIRRLLNPLLKLFFNPTPLIHALHTQARLNREAAAREAERERMQMEWNALHYEIVQRLVTEVSRVSLEMQALTLRVESLATRVDFADRRVRTLEASAPQATSRTASRPVEPPAPAAVTPAEPAATETPAAEGATAEGTRRRRRRRRGRRGATAGDAATTVVVGGSEGLAGPDAADLSDGDDGDEDDGAISLPDEMQARDESQESPRQQPAREEPDETDRRNQEPPYAPESSASGDVGASAAANEAPAAEPPDTSSAANAEFTHSPASDEPHFPVREGMAQGAPPPPENGAVESVAEHPQPDPGLASTAPTPPLATPPPDEPVGQPAPRDPGPPDR
jgi:hypothetical protein